MKNRGGNYSSSKQVAHQVSSDAAATEAMYETELKYGIKGWFKKGFRNYANFKGRARRKEYWWFFIATVICVLLAYSIDLFILYKFERHTFSAIGFLAILITITPLFAVGARRLHDVGRSGWWQLLWIMPSVIAGIALVAGNMYALKAGIMPEDVVSVEAAAVSLTAIITAWFVIASLLMLNTSLKMNKHGLPAKRIGKKQGVKEKRRKVELKEITKNKPLD